MHYEIIDRETGYNGYFKILRYRLKHAMFKGGISPEIRREVFHRGHAVAVLPYDPVADSVVLTEQFRVGALDSAQGPWLMEIVAGMMETGETPQEVARREAMEEADCELLELMPICHYLVSPGGSTESVHLYCARVDSEGLGGVHGLASETEDIRVHVVSFDEAWNMLETGVIHAAAPIIAMQWLGLNRERLRRAWLEDGDEASSDYPESLME